MKTRKLYKWFVWHPFLERYIPIDGLYPYSRAEYIRIFGVVSLVAIGLSKSFSISFFK